MFPFQIKTSISRKGLTEKEIDRLLVGKVNGRRITKIKRGVYEVEEPRPSKLSISNLSHEIRLSEDKVFFNSSSAIASLVAVLFILFIIVAIFNIYLSKGNFDYEFLLLLPIGWLIIPSFLYVSYLTYIPTLKKIKAILRTR